MLSDYEAVKRAVSALPRVGVGLQYGLPCRRNVSLAHPKRLLREVIAGLDLGEIVGVIAVIYEVVTAQIKRLSVVIVFHFPKHISPLSRI